MAYRVIPPSQWPNATNVVLDEGNNGYGYDPTNNPTVQGELFYDNFIQSTESTQANLVAVFDKWFRSYFHPMYWKWTSIRTQVPFSQWKSGIQAIYKKDKPILVIDPHTPEADDNSQVPLNLNQLTRFNDFDPDHQPIGTRIAYSNPIMQSDTFELMYRRARMRMDFDIMIIENTSNRRDNVYNHMLMRIPHRSQFMLIRTVPIQIPKRYIVNAALMHGYDWKSDEFLGFLNSISRYPIRKEIRTNGKYMFFMLQELHMYVEVPNNPGKDSPEMQDQIEWASRVTDTFTFTADLPLEFIFLTRREVAEKFDPGVEEDPEAVTFISPIYNDLDWPTEYGDFKLVNKLDVELQEGDNATMSILPILSDFDKKTFEEAVRWVGSGQPIGEIIKIHVYPNGSYNEIGSILRADGILELVQAQPNQLYTVLVYLNIKTLNLVQDGREKEYIGTIQQNKIPGL